MKMLRFFVTYFFPIVMIPSLIKLQLKLMYEPSPISIRATGFLGEDSLKDFIFFFPPLNCYFNLIIFKINYAALIISVPCCPWIADYAITVFP